MPPLPRQREELFAVNIASGMTTSEAYQAAGYRPDRANACRLTTKDRIRQRITELQQQIAKKTQVAVVKQATMSRQYLLNALIENVEVALGRRPVKLGPAAIPVEQYVYRGEVVNSAVKMAGSEVGLFQDRAEITHKMDFDDLSDEQLLLRLRDETEALLLERRAAGLDNGGDE
jgi:hypothetical protein